MKMILNDESINHFKEQVIECEKNIKHLDSFFCKLIIGKSRRKHLLYLSRKRRSRMLKVIHQNNINLLKNHFEY